MKSDSYGDGASDAGLPPIVLPTAANPAVTGLVGAHRGEITESTASSGESPTIESGSRPCILFSRPCGLTSRRMPVLKAGKAEQPKSISRILKPFQLEGLAWMMAMEKTEWRGGLLGDEMGLGKTIQAVSLIMSDYPAKKPSLVLVPPVALMQWGVGNQVVHRRHAEHAHLPRHQCPVEEA